MAIMGVLSVSEEADFKYLLESTGLTKGNLSRHLMKLEEAGYIEITKSFIGKIPKTMAKITKTGRSEFREYVKHLKTVMKKF